MTAFKVGDYEVSQEIVDKITVWAVTCPKGFNLAQLSAQSHRSRVAPDYAGLVAKKLIRDWKAADKISFVRGYWKWSNK